MGHIKEDESGVYVMAKEAHHMLGDVSRDDWDLAMVYMEDDEYLYGNWMYGYGFVNVKFPKESVRELTEEDVKKYKDTWYGIGGVPYGKLEIEDDRIWRRK